jgi:hypothetical protein
LKVSIEKKNQFNKKKQKKPIKWMRTNLKKITYPKLESKDKIEKNNFFIKWQRTKIKNKKNKNLSDTMKIYMANSNFKRRRKKREEKKKASWVINRATTDHTHHLKKKGNFCYQDAPPKRHRSLRHPSSTFFIYFYSNIIFPSTNSIIMKTTL